ncbi:hypothetical protein JKP75_01495 [Blastococcus sp. TML/M2B]|uniref:hypothetical protein n=1 Tax=unclassified Blastococcus TaxID=2619396 RepID=UPI00190B5B56|nr:MULTISPECIES: hypothetical protein [unclassified Blastococcus]MBN1091377.1 hypothetical protein [Blastococcus sp. TML/M2B]MBN1095067.1 hypothetical protein [Blastococcus sp. TML/C7B]
MAAGLAAALVAVPGTAAAADPDPVAEVTGFLDQLAGGAPSAQSVPGLPEFAVPPEIRDAFQQLADAAMLPENCVDGVADALELILNGLVALPLELADVLADLLALLGGGGLPTPGDLTVLEDLLDELLGGLTGGLGGGVPAPLAAGGTTEEEGTAPAATTTTAPATASEEEAPEEGAPAEESPELPTLVDGLLALGEALAGCLPALPAPGDTGTPQPAAPVASPTQQPPAATPAPVAAAPTAQPVAYLGYAPTGADAPRADDTSVPLTAVAGGLVLLAGAGAAGYGMRGRAVRSRG